MINYEAFQNYFSLCTGDLTLIRISVVFYIWTVLLYHFKPKPGGDVAHLILITVVIYIWTVLLCHFGPKPGWDVAHLILITVVLNFEQFCYVTLNLSLAAEMWPI